MRGAARPRESRVPYRTRLPGPVYCDTSALLKAYLPEPGSAEINRMLEGRDDLLASDLAVTEIVSALSRRLREGALARDEARRLHGAVVRALEDGVLRRVDLTRDVHRRAELFLIDLARIPLRAADALHLALATSNRAASLASFEARLGSAARSVGLAVYPE